MTSVVNIPGRCQLGFDKNFVGMKLTRIFREKRFADQVEELDLYTTQVLPDFCAFHLTQSNSQRPEQFAFTPLPELIESVLQYTITADGEHQVEVTHV
jgi:hypothetical protein